MEKLKRDDLIHPELSYAIIGCAYAVFNELGAGYAEKVYQRAMAASFNLKGISYREQVYCNVRYQGISVGKRYLDFLAEEKIVVELKRDTLYQTAHIDQVYEYLRIMNLPLGLLISFTRYGVRYKRVVNIL